MQGCNLLKMLKTIQSGKVNERHFRHIIPFERKFILIDVKAGLDHSGGKYNFIFDSGAGVSVISRKLADSLGLHIVSHMRITDSHGTKSKYDLVIIPEMDLNGLTFYNVGAVIADFGPYSAINCIGKDGIIGSNIIAKCNWTVDFENQTFTATDSSLDFPASATRVPFYGRIPHIDIAFNGAVVKGVYVDLGSSETIEIQQSAVDRNLALISHKELFKKSENDIEGFNGRVTETDDYYVTDSVEFGTQKCFPVQATITQAPMSRIGDRFWDKYLMGFDFRKQQLILIRNHTPVPDPALKGLGFNINRRDTGFYISAIFNNSPASDKGLKMNDQVLEINGEPVQKIFPAYCDLAHWNMTVLHDLQHITLKIKGRNDPVILNSAAYRPVDK